MGETWPLRVEINFKEILPYQSPNSLITTLLATLIAIISSSPNYLCSMDKTTNWANFNYLSSKTCFNRWCRQFPNRSTILIRYNQLLILLEIKMIAKFLAMGISPRWYWTHSKSNSINKLHSKNHNFTSDKSATNRMQSWK